MVRSRPTRLAHIAPIGVDRMGDIADLSGKDFLRLENLDVDIPPDPEAIACTKSSADQDQNNSYLPFIGQRHLREIAARHVSSISGVQYSGEENCIISSGGLSGILNVLLATVEVGDEVIVTDPTYAGLINVSSPSGGPQSKVRAMLLMSPSMPSGGYFNAEDWDLISKLCVEADLLLILDTAMERLLFDKRPLIHPAGLLGMANRTITVGAASKELRMIGWRVGWIVAPKEYIPDLIAVSLANVVVPVGIAQSAAAVALERSWTTMQPYVDELQARRDLILEELHGLPVGVPAGGWSLLLRVSDYGIDGETASKRLLEEGVCATGMAGWGNEHGKEYGDRRITLAPATAPRSRSIDNHKTAFGLPVDRKTPPPSNANR
ncbi:aspartate aminotransferase B [Coccidioides immitis RMSCC 3703]|uniref:Aspartate aminotransferase B n=1 Tax=Coccidioides immitis RMSCC 3703 TaxID=454286 RepID=A0A0J8RBP3_COCIT|nr:aspartate aminotransferase B [Coccidioides immitis RMSCC 3703]